MTDHDGIPHGLPGHGPCVVADPASVLGSDIAGAAYRRWLVHVKGCSLSCRAAGVDCEEAARLRQELRAAREVAVYGPARAPGHPPCNPQHVRPVPPAAETTPEAADQ